MFFNKYVIPFVLAFLLLYDVRPLIFGKVINLPLIIVGMFFLKYAIVNCKKYRIEHLKIVICLSLFTFLAILQVLLQAPPNGDKGLTYFFIELIVLFIGMAGIIDTYYERFKNGYVFLKMIILVGCAQALISLAMFLNNDIRSFVANNFLSDAIVFLQNNEMRGYGLSLATTFTLTIIQSLILFLIVYVLKNIGVKHVVYYALAYTIIAMSVILAGRTGMLGIALSFVIICLKSVIGNQKKNYRLFLGLILIIILLVISLISIFLSQNNQFVLWMQWAFELVYSFGSTGKLSTSSTNELLAMYQTLPDNPKTLLFGDGRLIGDTYNYWFETFSYYMNVDVGYLRLIFYSGIFMTFSFYGFYLFLIQKAFNYNRFSLCLAITISIYFLIIEMKGLFLINININLLIFCFYLISLKKKQNRERL